MTNSWRWDRSEFPALNVRRYRIWVYATDKIKPKWMVHNAMYEKIKEAHTLARKTNHPSKMIVGLLLGEIQTVESRNAEPMTNGDILKIIKKLKKSCDEVHKISGCATAAFESLVLSEYLPTTATQDEILEAIKGSELWLDILNADVPAKLIGKVQQLLKELGMVTEGKDIAMVVKGIK